MELRYLSTDISMELHVIDLSKRDSSEPDKSALKYRSNMFSLDSRSCLSVH